jgi:Ca2+-binding RTX toxin-like protein
VKRGGSSGGHVEVRAIHPGARRTALLASLACLAWPASVSAATTVERDGDTLSVVSGPEQNNVVVTYFDGAFIVSDFEAGVTTGSCEPLPSANQLSCPGDSSTRLVVTSEGGDDVVLVNVEIALEAVEVFGGNDDDTVLLIGTDARVEGGPGDDFIEGSAFEDRLVGGGGEDEIAGFAFDDLIIGGGGRDRLGGQGGDDNVRGGAGRDLIRGGGDRDWLIGGPGSDRLKARDRTKDHRINCGDGRRESVTRDRFDPRPRSC